MKPVVVHPRVFERHPELDFEEVLAAYKNAIVSVIREDGREVIAGRGTKNRDLELIVAERENLYLIFHAMPLSKKVRQELGIEPVSDKKRRR